MQKCVFVLKSQIQKGNVMKKIMITLWLGALIMGTSAMALPASPPPAPVEGSNGAIVINEDGIGSCSVAMYVPGYSGGENSPLYLFGTDVHVVQNKNMINTICKLDISEVLVDIIDLKKAYKTSDFTCMVWNYLEGSPVDATGQNFIITPSGEAKLECFYKVPKEGYPY